MKRFRELLFYFKWWLTMPVTWKSLMEFDKLDKQIDREIARRKQQKWN